ncbi:MAG: MMPL family transporter [Pseudomonadota bacterium]
MRNRVLYHLTYLVTSHPKKTLGIALLAIALFGLFIPGIQIKAGHSAFRRDDIHEHRFQSFLDEFGSPNLLFVLVEGGTPKARRNVVDRLISDLPSKSNDCVLCKATNELNRPGCVRDVLGHLDLSTLKNRALFYLPKETLEKLLAGLADKDSGLTQLWELDGLPSLIGAMATQVKLQSKRPPPQGEGIGYAKVATEALNFILLEIEARIRDPKQNELPLPEALANKFAITGRPARAGLDTQGYLASSDGKLLAAAVRPMDNSDEPSVVIPFVEYVQKHADSAVKEFAPDCSGNESTCSEGELRVTLTGLPALIADEKKVLNRDLPLTSLASGIGVLALFVFGFRSLRQGLLGLIPLGLSLVGTLAFVRLVYGGLNMITSAFIAVIVGLGIDFSVHLLSRYNEAHRKGLDATQALSEAITRAGPGIVTGALTTSGAFFALAMNEFPGFAQMGVITATGLLLTLLTTFTVSPALIACVPFWQKSPAPLASQRGLNSLPETIVRLRWPIFLGGLALTGLMFWRAGDIPWSYDYLKLLPKDRPSVKGMVTLSKRTDFSGEAAAMKAKSLPEARTIAAQLLKKNSIGRVESLALFIPENQREKSKLLEQLKNIIPEILPLWALPNGFKNMAPVDIQALQNRIEELGDIFEDVQFTAKRAGHKMANLLKAPILATYKLRDTLKAIPQEEALSRVNKIQSEIFSGLAEGIAILKAHVDENVLLTEQLLQRSLPKGLMERFYNGKSYALYAYPKKPIWDKHFLGEFVSDLRSVDPDATGFPVTHWETSVAIERGFKSASILAVVILLVLLLIDFKNIRYTLFAMAPLGLGVTWMWGSMSLLNIHYNFANIIAFPLIVGIGVASGVHILHRYRQEKETNVASVVRHTGLAVFLSAATTMVGFGSLMFAQHQGAASLGTLLVIGVGACLISATLFLPAMLGIFGKNK